VRGARLAAGWGGGEVSWTLHLGDCLDPVTGLASLQDKSVDHVITDPPYSSRLYTNTRTNRGTGIRSDNGRPFLVGEETALRKAREMAALRIGAIDDIMAPLGEQFRRVARRWLVVFHDIEIAREWRESIGADWYVRLGVWTKPNPMPQVSGDRPAQGFEAATICHAPGAKRWNGGGRAALWHFSAAEAGRPDHPCPKPLALMEQLVRDFTEPGETILDPFAGSGTTGVAAIRLGRNFIGWERDPKYHEIARRRLDGTREQLGLPATRAPKAKQGTLL